MWKGTDPAKWAQEQIAKLAQLQREAALELANEMATGTKSGGRVIEDTGNLKNSVRISARPITVAAPDAKFSKPNLSAVNKLELGGTIHVGWRVPYAHLVNYGRAVEEGSTGKLIAQGGAGFAEAIAANWPAIVERAAKKVQ